jgi:hypothetical protein
VALARSVAHLALGAITEPEVEVEVLEATFTKLFKKISEVDICTIERALDLKLISDFSASALHAAPVNDDGVRNPEAGPSIPILLTMVGIERH